MLAVNCNRQKLFIDAFTKLNKNKISYSAPFSWRSCALNPLFNLFFWVTEKKEKRKEMLHLQWDVFRFNQSWEVKWKGINRNLEL